MSVQITFIGAGRGDDSIYTGSICASFVLSVNGVPLLLVDTGFKVTKEVMNIFGRIPDNIFISHNHSDHAAELPFILSKEISNGRKLNVYSSLNTVKNALITHRMAELNSTYLPYNHWANWIGLPENKKLLFFQIDKYNLYIELLPSKHSEHCCGFILYQGSHAFNFPILSWSADSAFNRDFYDKLAVSPIVILDGRKNGSGEHASFNQILEWYKTFPDNQKPRLIITGYGDPHEKDQMLAQYGINFAFPGALYTL